MDGAHLGVAGRGVERRRVASLEGGAEGAWGGRAAVDGAGNDSTSVEGGGVDCGAARARSNGDGDGGVALTGRYVVDGAVEGLGRIICDGDWECHPRAEGDGAVVDGSTLEGPVGLRRRFCLGCSLGM